MRDPYEVLGVPRGASASAIKSAFRKLAKKLHPDANTNDPKAATRFSELNSAYEILGDEKKRKAFDAGEIDAEGKPRFAGFEGAHPGEFAQGRRLRARHAFRNLFVGTGRLSRAAVAARRRRRADLRLGGGIEDILKDVMGGMGGAARARGRAAPFESEDEGPVTGQDIRASAHGQPVRPDRQCDEARAAADRKRSRGANSARHRRRPDHPAQGPGLFRSRRHRRRADHGQCRAPSAIRARRQRSAARSSGHAL